MHITSNDNDDNDDDKENNAMPFSNHHTIFISMNEIILEIFLDNVHHLVSSGDFDQPLPAHQTTRK